MSASGDGAAITELIQLADALVGVESGRELLRGLERLLRSAQAVPARLYLVDECQGQLYLGACIDGEDDGRELAVELQGSGGAVAPDDQGMLLRRAAPTGRHARVSVSTSS